MSGSERQQESAPVIQNKRTTPANIFQHPLPQRSIWITPEQAASHLEVSQRTLARWMRETSIPYSRQGRVIRFDTVKLDKWMSNRDHGSGRIRRG